MDAPWLSVLMPTYDGAPWVGAALESVCAEADEGVEVVVVDDGSTDATLELVRAFQTRLPLRIAGTARVGNWVAGTNLALRAAAGRHACVLHQDDVWLPGRVAALRRALAADPPCALVVQPAVFIGARGERLGTWRTPFGQEDRLLDAAAFLERLLVQNFLAMPAPVVGRQAALRIGGLDEALWYTADWGFWLRLGALGPGRCLPQPPAGLRGPPASPTMARPGASDGF